ncbi:hypothetical protein YPPY54_1543, partial [Yersinia pestis PY-54]
MLLITPKAPSFYLEYRCYEGRLLTNVPFRL